MEEAQRIDWLATVGSEFSQLLEHVVNPAFLDPHEATEPLFQVLGTDFSPSALRTLTDERIEQLVAAFNRHFETDRVTASHIRDAVGRTLARW